VTFIGQGALMIWFFIASIAMRRKRKTVAAAPTYGFPW
jgi:hypothetical protein